MNPHRSLAPIPAPHGLDLSIVLRAFNSAALAAKRCVPVAVATAGMLGAVSLHAQTFTPVPLTPGSFTVNMVIPIDWTYKLNNQSVSITIDDGPSLESIGVPAGFPAYYSIDSGDTFFEQGLNRAHPTYGMPPSGSVLVSTSGVAHIYQMPNYLNASSNCICLAPYTNGFNYNSLPLVAGPYTYPVNNPYYAPQLTLNNTNGLGGFNTNIYTALSLLCSSGGPDTNLVTIQYADGTSQGPVLFVIPNWFVNAGTYTAPSGNGYGTTPTCQFAWTCLARGKPAEGNNEYTDNSGVSSGTRLWSIDIALSNTTSPPTNLIFNVGLTYAAKNSASTSHAEADVIFAVSGGTNPNDNLTLPNTAILNGPFSPIPVSGYNAGCVVANSPQNLAGLAPLTATMDNGTNLAGGANTWFELGWDGAAPTNGFPAHGSTIPSAANPGRTYQMAANYHANMATLIDTNHQMVNLTPQNVSTNPYTAVSLLTAGAAIGNGNRMTNLIVLQHSDGVNETNIFIGYDWFEASQPAAYVAGERCNIGTSGSTSGREVQNLYGGNPKMFDSEFQTIDGTPVTNIQVLYFNPGNHYGGTWTTYVIALSASTNFLPVQGVAGYTPAQNVYAGQNAVFSITPGIGSIPQYQWQYSDGATFTNNISNGASVVPGSSATISGATSPTLTINNVGAADAAVLYTCMVYNSAPSSTNGPLEVLSLRVSTANNVLEPGDVLSDFGETIATPVGLQLPNVEDGTLAAYLNYGSSGSTAGPFVGPVGFIVTPQVGSTVVNALRFYTAVNASVCDPADFALDGSNDGGNTWANIVPDTLLALPVERNLFTSLPTDVTNEVLQEVDFPNSTPYQTYRVTVDNVRSDSVANSMQIGEVQFLGVQQLVAPGLLVQPGPASKTLLVGGTYTTTALRASGPTNYTYQWYAATLTATNPVPNATNTSMTLTNVQLTNTGPYFCVVGNSYGSITSSLVTLTVIAPGWTYPAAVSADHPIAYWRLDEGPNDGLGNNGVVANDYFANHQGVYTNTVLSVPGYSADDSDTAALFGFYAANNSCVSNITGINFASPSNVPTAFSVEAWASNQFGIETIGGAGIVTYGYGGGGEQFALDCGANGASNAFRFYFRDATLGSNVFGNPAHDANGTSQSTADTKWHYLVGVLDEFHNAQYLYVDGLLVASNGLGTNLGVQQLPNTSLTIGARSSASGTNANLQFDGAVDEVALYPYALSPAQVLNHFYAAGIAPIFSLQPTNVVANQGTTATIATRVYGSPVLGLQWYEVLPNGATNGLPGQTGTNLVLNDVQPDPNGIDQYFLVASNGFGTNFSDEVTLTVNSGPPIITQNLQSSYVFFAGYPFQLSVAVDGTPPFTYGWYYNGSPISNGGRVSGANSNVLTIANAQLSDSGSYQVFVTNSEVAPGSVPSQAASVTVVPTLGFNGFGGGWMNNAFDSAGNPFTYGFVGSNVLQLTDGAIDESSSSFFQYPVYVGSFEASFTYQDVGSTEATADGACLVIQNDARGASALGGGGGSLGVSGITPSAELELNIYHGNGAGGVGYAFSVNGAIANVTDPYPVVIDDGDAIAIHVNYLNGVVSLSLSDPGPNGSGSYSTSFPFNLTGTVGGDLAFVGFTGADGGTASVQQISNFNFVSIVPLTIQTTSPTTALVSWPTGVGAYVLQSSTSLSPPTWSNVGTPVVVSGQDNTVTISTTGPALYYQLHLQYTPQ